MTKLCTGFKLRWLVEKVTTESGAEHTVRTLQYAQFFIDPVTRTEDQEADWYNVEEVSADSDSLDPDTEDQLTAAALTNELPAFLRYQAD